MILGNDRLCTPRNKIDIHDRPLSIAMEDVLGNSGYHVGRSGEDFIISTDAVSQEQAKRLDLRIENFAPPRAPMHVLGVFLMSYIEGTLHPDQGFAGDIPSSTSARTIRLEKLSGLTAEGIANRIVQEDGKGVWLMPFLGDLKQQGGAQQQATGELEVYSYEDDARAISELSCEGLSGPAENR
jgi:hypothetical protein